MKISEMSNTKLRVLTSVAMFAVLVLTAVLSKYFPHLQPVRWLAVLVVAKGLYETIKCYVDAGKETFQKHSGYFFAFALLLVLMLVSAYVVGAHKWIMLWLLMIVVGADVGAWLFGKIFGGDKMWERLSAHKTWSGQIGGIICGTLMSVVFFAFFKPFGNDVLFPILLGISFSLLSQYGDLTASFIKRSLGIKDFSNILPGHGGIMDRIDGWIYILPFMLFFIG